ncbi:hypothetical protein GF357_00275 [Candidatus Dojkabacteria bacterium]|nr:hypothetical protein [Candidatus Dojkabacteria bacterium]
MPDNIFNNMKDLYKMQREAKKMQKKLQEQKIVAESKTGKVTLFMNAAQEYEDIQIDESLLDPEMMDLLRKEIKSAFKNFQKKLQKEMKSNFDMDDLKGMF